MQREIPLWVGVIVIVIAIAIAVLFLVRGSSVRKIQEEPMAPLKMLQKYGAPGVGSAPSVPSPGR